MTEKHGIQQSDYYALRDGTSSLDMPRRYEGTTSPAASFRYL